MKLATLCYVKSGGRTLMIHRIKKQGDMHAGKWNGLGGKFEPGESPEECVIREVMEESGLAIVNPRLVGLLTFPAFSKEEDWYAFVFLAHEFSGELIDSSEGVLAWVDDDKVLGLNLWEGDRVFLKWLDLDGLFSAKFTYHEGGLTDYQAVFYTPGRNVELLARESGPLQGDEYPGPTWQPASHPEDDHVCWVCNAPVVHRHCKIVCPSCGFMRDCSDP